MAVHVFGIRHHGPGSARSLLAALRRVEPDAVLVEGPVEADSLIPWIANPGFKPPVALLVFRPDEPLSSVFYPFASFSPEWNALAFALENRVAVRFLDLPKTHWLAMEKDAGIGGRGEDPLETIARLAGEADFERWWDRLVESRDEPGVFPAIHEAMAALRDAGSRPEPPLDVLREAAMRQQIRQVEKEGFTRIAVVCGAWHAPALANPRTAKTDAALLKGLPKVKVQVTWAPWTHGRLMRASGYGAGIESPGWYEHLWTTPRQTTERWVAKVARLLRDEDLDASPAQVVDAVRLAEALAAFRGRKQPGLLELNDAVEAALTFGNAAPSRLIHDRLIAGEVLGEVPSEAVSAPLQRDLEALQKRLRLEPKAQAKNLDLDLRKENDRERSQLLHRLGILDVPWGAAAPVHGKLGTFHEVWRLEWKPEFAVQLIAAAQWGNTVEAASTAAACHAAEKAAALPELTGLLEPVLHAHLPAAASKLLFHVRRIGAVAPDIADLMDTIPPLAGIARYGDVRETDQATVRQATDELLARVCAGLPAACGSLNDEAARRMTDRIAELHRAVTVFDPSEQGRAWRHTLRFITDLPRVHGLVCGRCARICFDSGELEEDGLAERASRALSVGTDPAAGAAWMEGLLENSGGVLAASQKLWTVVDGFVQNLAPETFSATLPLLRRTFATFATADRRTLGERVRQGQVRTRPSGAAIDTARAARALPLLAKILGLEEADGR